MNETKWQILFFDWKYIYVGKNTFIYYSGITVAHVYVNIFAKITLISFNLCLHEIYEYMKALLPKHMYFQSKNNICHLVSFTVEVQKSQYHRVWCENGL